MVVAYIRTAVLYLVLVGVIRVMGKRQVGQMEPAEFAVTMLAANLASIPMEDGSVPLAAGLIPLLTILGTELTLNLAALKNIRLRRLICGKPVILIENGRLLQRNLRSTRLTLDELTELLRLKDVLDLTKVQYAILETNGQLSVFPFPAEVPPTARDLKVQPGKQKLPITLVSDGRVLGENLKYTGKDRAWLDRELESRGGKENTLLLTLDGSGRILHIPREGRL